LPIRDGDENPSFKVDTIRNLWFDHGAATGGNIIDLVREICSCDVRNALQHLDRSGLYPQNLQARSVSAGISRGAVRRSDTALKSKNLEGEKQKTGRLSWSHRGHFSTLPCYNISRSAVLIMILRAHTSLRSILRPLTAPGSIVPSSPLGRWFRDA